MSERDPWQRQPKEPANAYGGFRVFRDLGPKRTLVGVVAEYATPERTVKRWAKLWDWVDRATAWDDHAAQLEDETRLKALREMQENHFKLARIATTKALQALDRVEIKHIAPGTAVRLLDFAVKLERETLSRTPEQMAGLAGDGEPVEDPWDEIARAFTSG